MTLHPHSNHDPSASTVKTKSCVADWSQPNILSVPDAILAAAFAPSSCAAASVPALFLGTAHGKVISYGVTVSTGSRSVVVTPQRSFQCTPDPSQLLCVFLDLCSLHFTRHTCNTHNSSGIACTCCQCRMTPPSAWLHQVSHIAPSPRTTSSHRSHVHPPSRAFPLKLHIRNPVFPCICLQPLCCI